MQGLKDAAAFNKQTQALEPKKSVICALSMDLYSFFSSMLFIEAVFALGALIVQEYILIHNHPGFFAEAVS